MASQSVLTIVNMLEDPPSDTSVFSGAWAPVSLGGSGSWVGLKAAWHWPGGFPL